MSSPEPAYVRKFAAIRGHPCDQAQLIDQLQRDSASDWPRLWGHVWSHLEACMVAAYQALEAALADPTMTREGLRRRMLAELAEIAERGPRLACVLLRGRCAHVHHRDRGAQGRLCPDPRAWRGGHRGERRRSRILPSTKATSRATTTLVMAEMISRRHDTSRVKWGLGVLQHFGTNDSSGPINRFSDPISTADPGIGFYHPRFDRGGQDPEGDPWDELAADGAIGFGDFLSLLRQFGHNCA